MPEHNGMKAVVQAGLGVIARRCGLPVYGTKATLDAVLSVKSVGKIEESLLHPIVE